jgi:CRP-like cAMP-binding protein
LEFKIFAEICIYSLESFFYFLKLIKFSMSNLPSYKASFSIVREINPGSSDINPEFEMESLRSGSLKSDMRLFLSISRSPLLDTKLFEPKTKIMSSGSQVDFAYLITQGNLVAVKGDSIYRLGPGSVIGLAEGLINQPFSMNVITTTAVLACVIPLHKIDATISRLPPEVKAILKTIINRIIA